MNNLMNKVNRFLGQVSMNRCPELNHQTSNNMDYILSLANSTRIYDPMETRNSINWKLI